MASGAGVTSTGLEEMRKAVRDFPAAEQAALKEVARQTALRQQRRAKSLLRAQQKTDAHALADLIRVAEDTAHKQYQVISQAPTNQPANLPTWVERGTRFMRARAYMRPAMDGERDRYRRDTEAASLAAATKTFAG